MKLFRYILSAGVVALAMTACNDLDLEPKGVLDEGLLFNSDFGVQKYFAGLYDDLPIEDFLYYEGNDMKGYGHTNQQGARGNRWEQGKNAAASCSGEALGRNTNYGNGWKYWPYDKIRLVNNFLENFPTYAENFTEEQANSYIAEARFLRAFYYFGMVKRYGGVPIVDKVLDPTAPDDELRIGRSTEYDSWKFIYDDLKFAMDNMSAEKVKGRANRYVAAALMSRAMLYAGTTARYNDYYITTGPATAAGLMGMKGDDIAKEFLEYSYDAAQFVRDGGYSLHQGSDKAKAYSEVFIEDLNGEEDIFVKEYGKGIEVTPDGYALYNSWDITVLPMSSGMAQAVGMMLDPTWEMIDKFEHPAIVDENGYPVRFDRREDFWDSPEMEARCRGTFFFSGMEEPASKEIFDFQSGIYDEMTLTYEELTPDTGGDDVDYIAAHRTRAERPGTSKNGVQISGKHGASTGTGDEGYSASSSCIRKYVNYKATTAERTINGGQQGWKVFRFGEIVCNEMEAAYELYLLTGESKYFDAAQNALNELRDRAGASQHNLVPGGGMDVGTELYAIPVDENLEFIRDERARELCFENHRIFDLRRWKTYDKIFDNTRMHVLSTYYITGENKYVFLGEWGGAFSEGRQISFNKSNYYETINMDSNNRLIIQNDGY